MARYRPLVNPSALLAALDIVAFEATGNGRFRSLGPVPSDLTRRFGALADDEIELGVVFPFLVSWLDDLSEVAAPDGSGRWAQADDGGDDCQLDATALWDEGRCIVMIEFASSDSRRLRAVLQAAREQRLAQERLEKAQVELQLARDQLELRVEERTSELVAANTRLLDYQAQLRSLIDQLGVVEERERRRIATYLHDHVGQSLAVAKMKLGALSRSSPAGLEPEIADLASMLDAAIAETRTLTFDLASPVLYELGLESALESLAHRFEKDHGIAVDYRGSAGGGAEATIATGALLFQSVRELLHNIAKHAAPSRVSIRCAQMDDAIEVQVEDDGAGFDVSRAERGPSADGGFGLFNIRERLALIGGAMALDSSPGSGTRITLRAPLDKVGAQHPAPPVTDHSDHGKDSPR